MKRWIYFLFLSITISGIWCRKKKRGVVYFHNDSLVVEIVETPEELEKGLMGRKSLPENGGMLFIFEREGVYPFWMKDTYIPLSIAFIDRNYRIIHIEDMEPLDTISLHLSISPIRYALEVNRSWFKRHGIKKGDPISLPIR